jgi:hypothetical protein
VERVNNAEFDGGGGLAIAGSSVGAGTVTVINSIVFGNEAAIGADIKIRDYGAEYTAVHVSYSGIGDVYGNLTTSNHLIRTDPLFANPASGDFHLLYGSPCIDAGEPGAGGGIDMDGEPRPFGPAIDMGADEFTDADGDHLADYWETSNFGLLTNSDGTADGDADGLNDFAEYTHQTDPQNPDTDGDGMEDGDEVVAGTCPTDLSDCLEIKDADVQEVTGGFVLWWDTVTGRYYGVYSLSDMAEFWSNVYQTAGDDSRQSYTSPPGNGPQRYFRLGVSTNAP